MELSHNLPNALEHRMDIQLFQRPPWRDKKTITINATLEGVKNKGDPPSVIKAAAERVLAQMNPDITIYTDGSADAGTSNGGAAAVITEGSPECPIVTHVIKSKGAPATTSYEEEVAAMGKALEWVNDHAGERVSVLIITDSQSLCVALREGNENLNNIQMLIDTCDQEIMIQWVPGHAGIEGNELADKHAKDATKLNEPPRKIS